MKRITTLMFTLLLAFAGIDVAEAKSLSKIFSQVDHSVVVVRTVEKQISPKKEKGLVSAPGIGSGVLISEDGQVLTASHVVHTADAVAVELWDGRIIPAQIIGSASDADVALLQLLEIPDDLSPAKLGDSDEVEIGDEIFVVGTPYGVGRTLSAGHIGARHQPSEKAEKDELAMMFPVEMFQTDAAINMGNSGGPMFDEEGRVIGLVSHIITRSGGFEGLGFAVTSNVARERLLEEKAFWAGISSYLLTDDLAKIFNLPQPAGLLVQQVASGSPSALLGVKAGDTPALIGKKRFLAGGDIVLEMEGIPVTADPSFSEKIRSALNALKPGDPIHGKVLRAGKVVDLHSTVPL